LGEDGWWDWHLKENYEYMSPQFWERLGYNPEDMGHTPSEWQSLVPKEDLEIVMS
jgi:hypothetical protein